MDQHGSRPESRQRPIWGTVPTHTARLCATPSPQSEYVLCSYVVCLSCMYALISKCCCCCPCITVQAMISRSSERVKQLALHRNPATDSSTDQCALIRYYSAYTDALYITLLTSYCISIYVCVCFSQSTRAAGGAEQARHRAAPAGPAACALHPHLDCALLMYMICAQGIVRNRS